MEIWFIIIQKNIKKEKKKIFNLVLGLSIYYSILSSSLSINVKSTITNSTWEIGINGNYIECPIRAICTLIHKIQEVFYQMLKDQMQQLLG